jgi:hypothetical protein
MYYKSNRTKLSTNNQEITLLYLCGEIDALTHLKWRKNKTIIGNVTITSVKDSLNIVLLAHIQLQFDDFNIYDWIRLYKKLRSIPMSDLVAQFRKPKK